METAERVADGEEPAEALPGAYRPARRVAQERSRERPDDPFPYHLIAPADAAISSPFDAARTAALDAGWTYVDGQWQEESTAYAAQAALVPCIFSPFRTPGFPASWRSATAIALARTCYESREFGAMPLLADALQDEGCDDEAVLAHCRGPGPHTRGCHVIDMILGRS